MPPIQRRTFLADLGMGFTGLALGSLLQRDGFTRARADTGVLSDWAPPNGRPHFRPRPRAFVLGQHRPHVLFFITHA